MPGAGGRLKGHRGRYSRSRYQKNGGEAKGALGSVREEVGRMGLVLMASDPPAGVHNAMIKFWLGD